MCEQDEAWGESRYFSEQRISELYEDRPDPVAPSDDERKHIYSVLRKAGMLKKEAA